MKLTIQEVSDLLGGTASRNSNDVITTLSSLKNGVSGSISFLSNPKYESELYNTRASAVLVRADFSPSRDINPILIKVADPYVSFALLLEEYQKLTALLKTGINKMSDIGSNTQIGNKPYIGAFVSIGTNSVIGDNVKIFPNVSIGDNVTIGDNSVIYSGATIYDHTEIGNYCVVHAGAVIGSDGFGFAPMSDGSYRTIPQVGNVILEDHVSVGANTVVDCATFDSTIIRKGVKLDNLIQVAHNVEIDENTVIAAQTGISGSTKIGKNCVIGGQVGIAGHIEVAPGSKVGGKTGVTKTLKDADSFFGNPAMNLLQYNRSYSVFKKLPELMNRIESLEEKILS